MWDSPWLRGLDGAARAQLEAAGRVRSLEKGAHVFAAGEPADAVHVVAAGLVDVRRVRRGESEARPLRRAVAGDAVGEEAVVRPGAPRAAEATCATRVLVADVPVAVFRRAAARAGAGEGERLEAALRRAAARDALRASAVGHALAERDVEALVEAAQVRELARDGVLFAQGDPATHAYVVGDGMVQVRAEHDGRLRVRAYLAAGDLVVDGGLDAGAAHEVTVAACGPAWVLAIERAAWVRVARRVPGAVERARRLVSAAPSPGSARSQESGLVHPTSLTRHVLGDLARFAEAGSMLVLDDEACVRCGACAWACADAHGDGVSRLVRRGDKVAVRDAADGSERALVVPGSCQHCKHPACMLDCPTGAIGRETRPSSGPLSASVRDPVGDVFVREEACVGCGRCVKACPWGSVQMAPRTATRAGGAAKGGGGAAAEAASLVAVKCDLCRDVQGGPACVSACPADAIARIDPAAALVDVRRLVRPAAARQGLPARRAAWPWVTGAALVGLAASRVPAGGAGGRLATGVAAGVLVAALAAYAVVKRVRLRRRPAVVSATRPHAIAHAAMGALAAGVVAAHAGGHVPANVAGALFVAFALACVTGAVGAASWAILPRALSRVERRALLPEDLPARARDLDDRAFGALTGRSDATKAVYARWLAPYARAPLGGLALVLRRATLRDEEKRLRARIDAVLGERAARLDGLDDLVRLAVERRAVRAQRWLQGALRAWVPAHVVAVAVAAVLLVAHVAAVLGWR